MSDSLNAWWITIFAAVPSVASGFWVGWRWWFDRDDKRNAEELTREQVLMRDLDLQRTATSREASDIFERVKLELIRRDAEAVRRDAKVDLLEKEIERWINVARGWQTRSFSLKHAFSNAQQEINGLRAQAGQPQRVWEESQPLPRTLEAPES